MPYSVPSERFILTFTDVDPYIVKTVKKNKLVDSNLNHVAIIYYYTNNTYSTIIYLAHAMSTDSERQKFPTVNDLISNVKNVYESSNPNSILSSLTMTLYKVCY